MFRQQSENIFGLYCGESLQQKAGPFEPIKLARVCMLLCHVRSLKAKGLCLCECNAHVAPHHPQLQEAALFLRCELRLFGSRAEPGKGGEKVQPRCWVENFSLQRLESPQRSKKKN